MSNVIIYPESLSASVIGKELSAKTPTELYVAVMTEILKNRPQIIGQKETHFTTDSVRAGQYTGTTREVYVNNTKVYIKTGLSTNDKWKGIGKTCQLAGLTFEVDGQAKTVTNPAPQSQIKPTVTVNNSKPADSVNLENVIDDYIKIIQLALEDVLYKSDKALEYYNNLPQNKRNCLEKYSESKKILSVECEFIDLYIDDKTDILMAELERYAQNGNKLASYYMSIWYSSGFIGVRSIGDISFDYNTTNRKLYILKPDIQKANYYREDSACSGYADACYAQACYLMNKSGNDENAVKYFEKAKKLGCKNAEIMLRYFNQPENQVVYNTCIPFDSFNRCSYDKYTYKEYGGLYNSISNGTVYEYNGYLYYMKYIEDPFKKGYYICKKSLHSDDEEIILRHILEKEYESDIFTYNSYISKSFPMGCDSYFGIYNDRIYFKETHKIFSMNLDGEDVRQISIPEKISKKMYYPHAVESGIICTNNSGKAICFYDYSTGVLNKISNMNKLVAITNDEVYFLDKTSMYVYNIKLNTVSNINDIYQGLKKHTAIYIDVKREIIYYLDDITSDITSHRIIGINKSGEIVDIWEKPRIYKDFLNTGGYDGIAFNGKSFTGIITNSRASAKNNLKCNIDKTENDYSFKSTILSFDRAGNVHCIYKENSKDKVNTAMHILKDSVYITMFQGQDGVYSTCFVPLNQDMSNNHKLMFKEEK